MSPRISVVIPALNEAAVIGAAIDSARGAAEVIVADGGSEDETALVAAGRGAEVVRSPPGRGRQMNRGAAAAGGDVLLFLHADTLLPPGFDACVADALGGEGVVAGAFRLRIDGPGRALRIIERSVNLRSRLLRLPYGDQALFLAAATFHALGGFHELAAMEDFELVRRLRRRGRVALADEDVLTSARHWQSRGPWRTTLLNQACVLAWLAGVPAQRIAAWRRAGSSATGEAAASADASAG